MLTGDNLLNSSLLRFRQTSHTSLEDSSVALQVLMSLSWLGLEESITFTWLTRLTSLCLATLSGARTSTATASAMIAITLGRLLLLLPRMCWLLDSIKSARKPYTKGASSTSSVTGSQENLIKTTILLLLLLLLLTN